MYVASDWHLHATRDPQAYKGQHFSCCRWKSFHGKVETQQQQQCLPSAAKRQHIFFFLKVKVLNFMCLENSFPKKINAKFCSLNIISKVNRVILVLLDYDLVFLLYCTLSYTMSTTETKTATRSNDALPTSLPMCACGGGREMLAFKLAYTRWVWIKLHRETLK